MFIYRSSRLIKSLFEARFCSLPSAAGDWCASKSIISRCYIFVAPFLLCSQVVRDWRTAMYSLFFLFFFFFLGDDAARLCKFEVPVKFSISAIMCRDALETAQSLIYTRLNIFLQFPVICSFELIVFFPASYSFVIFKRILLVCYTTRFFLLLPILI